MSMMNDLTVGYGRSNARSTTTPTATNNNGMYLPFSRDNGMYLPFSNRANGITTKENNRWRSYYRRSVASAFFNKNQNYRKKLFLWIICISLLWNLFLGYTIIRPEGGSPEAYTKRSLELFRKTSATAKTEKLVQEQQKQRRQLQLQQKDDIKKGVDFMNNNNNNNNNNNGRIPRRLIFTGKDDIFVTKSPTILYENVLNTINSYLQIWEDDPPEIVFLDDKDCEMEIQQADPRLLPFFFNLTRGALKGDICRVAALYNSGGYYFDLDMKVVQPITLEDATTTTTTTTAAGGGATTTTTTNHKDDPITFSTVMEAIKPMVINSKKAFFQSFIASRANHPILRQAFEEMLAVFEGRPGHAECVDMGTCTLRKAYDKLTPTERGHTKLFQEQYLVQGFHTELDRIPGWGGCCNYVIHDPEKDNVHFFSRVGGLTYCCAEHPGTWLRGLGRAIMGKNPNA